MIEGFYCAVAVTITTSIAFTAIVPVPVPVAIVVTVVVPLLIIQTMLISPETLSFVTDFPPSIQS